MLSFIFFIVFFVFFQVCCLFFFFWFWDIRVEGKGRFFFCITWVLMGGFLGYQGWRKGQIFCITWVLMGGFLFYYFSFLYWFFSFLHMFAFLWFKMNWIVHLIWASGSFFSHQHNFCKWPRKGKERHSRGCTAKIRLCIA